MNRLCLVSGAGINLSLAMECPEAKQLGEFTYQHVSQQVYDIVSPELRQMFSPGSFDYILGGLMTINLVIEKTKTNLRRFEIDEDAFSRLFQQSGLQQAIVDALAKIEDKLTVELEQMIDVLKVLNPAMCHLQEKFQSIHYFTVNFDGLFDHIIYGPKFARIRDVTDFWNSKGFTREHADRQFLIYHLHGDLRYKPNKKTKHNDPPYRWPVLVVGDGDFKRGIIAGNESLSFFNKQMQTQFSTRAPDAHRQTLAVIGFGCREEDKHVVSRLTTALENKVFDRILVYDVEDRLTAYPHEFVDARKVKLSEFLTSLN